MMRRIALVIALLGLHTHALGQNWVPIGDHPDQPIQPTGIPEVPLHFSSELVYLFKAQDGSEALHLLGGAEITIGDTEPTRLRAKQAVVWIVHRAHDNKPYLHCEILLWQDAVVEEPGGTLTTGPALFVLANAAGDMKLSADEFAYQSSRDSRVYRDGLRIRQVIAPLATPSSDLDAALRMFDATGMTSAKGKPKPRPTTYLRAGSDVESLEIENRMHIAVKGGVYLQRGTPGEDDFLDVHADSAVVVLPPDALDNAPGGKARDKRENADEKRAAALPELPLGPRGKRKERADEQRISAGFGDLVAEAVYLEGDVRMVQGNVEVSADRLYFDFQRNRALIVDGQVKTAVTDRKIPVYLRAAKMRQISQRQFVAEDAVLTTSEFHTPHYHVGASRIELINRTPTEPTGEDAGIRSGSFRIRHATLNISGTPVMYWPFVSGNIDVSETSLRGLRLGYSDDFGAEIETDWHLFNLLNLETPHGFNATLSLDYFTQRGPAVGLQADYTRDEYYSLLRSYLLGESGNDFLGRERESSRVDGTRGRFLLRHRQYMEDDWQLTLELSYITDRGFLEEFFENEFDNDKAQETLIHVKRQKENWAFTGLLQWRVLDWLTATESLPDFAFHWMGPSPINDGGFYSENRAGFLRYRPKDRTLREIIREGSRAPDSDITLRIDSRQEIDQPLDVGPVRVIPFVSGRVTAWDDTISQASEIRGLTTYGIRSSMYLWKVFPDIHNELLDINGLRHLIKPDITVWGSHTNVDSNVPFPFHVRSEGIDEIDGVTMGVRQRFQTKRGPKNGRRNVDVLTLDAEVGFFNDVQDPSVLTNGFASYSRPENSIARNYAALSAIYRINDRTAFVTEANYDLNEGNNEIYNLSLVVERTPRLSYLLGYRFIGETDSNLMAFDANYRFTDKHSIALRESFDLARGQINEFTIALIRRFPHWYTAVVFDLDRPEDDFGVSLSVWPEGLPNAAIGSRRFTGLSQSTTITGPAR